MFRACSVALHNPLPVVSLARAAKLYWTKCAEDLPSMVLAAFIRNHSTDTCCHLCRLLCRSLNFRPIDTDFDWKGAGHHLPFHIKPSWPLPTATGCNNIFFCLKAFASVDRL